MEPRYLPEHVETEILVRVPALQLLKFRRVCERWNDLISSQYFQNTHLIQSKEPDSPSPTIIVQIAERKLIISDKSEKRGKTMVLKDVPNFEEDNLSFDTMCILFCHDGFIVMEGENDDCVIIYNPVTRETMVINNSETGSKFRVYALFFNQWINEYCAILIKLRSDEIYYDKFEMLNLGSRPYCCKPLKTLDSMRSYSYHPGFERPVVINNANIYWQIGVESCEEFILGFNIKAEEFCLLPHPHLSQCQELNEVERHWNVHIADIHGCLSFVQYTLTRSAVTFNIWMTRTAAADHQQQEAPKWIKTYSVVINIGIASCRLNSVSVFEVLMIQNGEIVFVESEKICAYVYNLQRRTLRKIFYKKSNLGCFFRYVSSFASLNKFESKICI